MRNLILILTFMGLSTTTLANSIGIENFRPKSQVRTHASVVKRPAFSVIDFHSHLNWKISDWWKMDPKELIKILDQSHIEKVAILTGGFGEELDQIQKAIPKLHRDRFVYFTELDWTKVNEPGFAKKMVLQIQDSVKRGAIGLKIMKNFGLKVKDRRQKLYRVDDPRFNPIWRECGRLGIPVAIHTGDPSAFFDPIDAKNERYAELKRFPSWSFHGKGFPSKKTLLKARNRLFSRFPETQFIAVHFANHPEDIESVRKLMKRYPNVWVDISARQTELGRQPRAAREFFIEFQDRILFATDARPEVAMYRSYYRWLETNDEYFRPHNWPGQGMWRIYGLNLPKPVLEKIYRKNALRLLDRIHQKLKENKI